MFTGRRGCKKIQYMIFGLLLIAGLACTGCGNKSKNIKVFEYETGEDGKVTITGLTDKGKNDYTLTVPATIDGAEVATIGAGAFRDDVNVKSVELPEGIERISENAFMNCISLENITIPQSVTVIGTNAFENSAWQKKILDDSLEVVVNNILIRVQDGVKEYKVPSGIKTIGPGVFYNNKELTAVTFNSELEAIGDYSFSDCTALSKAQLPSGVKSVGYCAFNNCTALEIEVPSGVKDIGQDAFANVANVTYLK